MKTLILAMSLFCLSAVVQSHEGLHAAGQLNVGLSHVNLFEVSVTVLVVLTCYAWARKKIK